MSGDKVGSKIGLTNGIPADRLRLLQQGNPRKLVFKYMWVGLEKHVAQVESTIKRSRIGGSEWRPLTPEALRILVITLIEEYHSDIHEIKENLPYSYRSYGTCPWYKNDVDIYDLYRKYSGSHMTNAQLIYKDVLSSKTAFDQMFEKL